MSKKVSDLEGAENEKVYNEVMDLSNHVTGTGWRRNRIRVDSLGLCNDCDNLMACRSQYGKVTAHCSEFERTLVASDPVVECTAYEKYGQLTIREMIGMAYIIEIKKDIGF